MKKKLYIIVGVAVMTLLLVWWLRSKNVQPSIVPSKTDQQAKVAPLSATVGKDSTVTLEDVAKTPWTGTDEQKRARISEVRDIAQQANQPISFYGKVIDQDNVPLPGVKVRLGIKHTREFLPGAIRDVFDYIDQTTDVQGLFSLAGQKGALVGIEAMEKSGYKAPYLVDKTYWYWAPVPRLRHTPNVNTPVIFRMWKLQGAEHLVRKGIGTRIRYDGQSVIFDLQAGREVKSGGDIKVTLLRTPLQIKRGQDKYDWTATIEAVDGGLIVSTDEFMYRAPESGYQPKLTISVSAKDPKWSSDQEVSFYLKSRETYARVQAKFMTDSEKPTTGFDVSAYINPKVGSRNLEYDSLQGVAKP